MTARRCKVLIDGLPPESATLTAIRDSMTPGDLAAVAPRDGHGVWSHTDMLLAEIADRVAEQTWALGQWKRQPPRPKPIPRPGVGGQPARSTRTLDDVKAAAGPEAVAAAERLLAGRRRT